MIVHLASADVVPIALAVAFLLCAFLVSGKFRLGQIVRYFILQSLFLTGLLVSLAVNVDKHLYYAAGLVLLFKVFIIPTIITQCAQRSAATGRLTSFVRPAPSYFVSGATLLLSVLVAKAMVPALGEETDFILEVTALAAMFLGGAMMAVRRDVYSQIIGFLTFENGITILTVATLGALPLVADIGILITLTLSVWLFCLLSRRLKELYAVEDATRLHELVD